MIRKTKRDSRNKAWLAICKNLAFAVVWGKYTTYFFIVHPKLVYPTDPVWTLIFQNFQSKIFSDVGSKDWLVLRLFEVSRQPGDHLAGHRPARSLFLNSQMRTYHRLIRGTRLDTASQDYRTSKIQLQKIDFQFELVQTFHFLSKFEFPTLFRFQIKF